MVAYLILHQKHDGTFEQINVAANTLERAIYVQNYAHKQRKIRLESIFIVKLVEVGGQKWKKIEDDTKAYLIQAKKERPHGFPNNKR